MADQEPQPKAEFETNHSTPDMKMGGRKMTRREFLKLSLLGLAGLTGLKNLADYFNLLGQLEETAFTADLPDEVPQSLKNSEIPKRNEHLRKPQQLVQEAFELYNGWQKEDQSLLKLHWSKPDNFLDYGDIVSTISQPPSTPGNESLERLIWKLQDAVFENDKPYSKFGYFSFSDINGASDFVTSDPGSGMVRKVVEKFKSLKNDRNYDLYSEIESTRFSEQDYDFLLKEIKNLVGAAIFFIEDKEKGKSVSTSVLLAYFLRQNEGNISQSFWDTTTVLKFICRNDLNSLAYKPTRKGAEQLGDLFLDEFSPNVSLNWLIDHVSPSDSVLNTRESLDELRYKNYQPINRAGGLYHAWNIISWTTCMSPDLVMNLTRGYYFGALSGKYDMRPTNGSEKVRADLRIASYTGDINSELMPYYKS